MPRRPRMFEAALQSSAQLFLSGRERAKTNVVMVINEMRVALREFGRRLVERGVIDQVEQVFMVTNDELDQLRLHPDTITRRDRRALEAVPVVVRLRAGVHRQRAVPALSEMTRRGGKDLAQVTVGIVLDRRSRFRWNGDGAGEGHPRRCRSRRTRARRHPDRAADRPVVGATLRAGRRRGGQRGRDGEPRHDRVPRELGVPCVASVADATEIIPDGATVTVDGNAGTVTIDALPA